MTQRDRIFLFLAVIVVSLFAILSETRDQWGFPLDDAWIHQTYARNLADSGEWAFLAGEASAASTAPFYTVVLSVGHLLNLSPLVWANILGVLALALAASMAARIAEQMYPDTPIVGWATGLIILSTWHVVWTAASGMETMLFMALSLTLLHVAFREIPPLPDQLSKNPRKQRRQLGNIEQFIAPRAVMQRGALLGVIGGLLTLTRPEGMALLGLIGLVAWFAFGVSDIQRYGFWAIAVGIGWLIVITPYTAWNYNLTGDLLPSTAGAKMAEFAPLREQSLPKRYTDMLIPILAGAQFIAIPGIVVGLRLLWQKTTIDHRTILFWVPLLWAIAHLTIFVIRLPAAYQHGRYVIPILPPLLLYASAGLIHLVQRYNKTPLQRVATRTLAASIALGFPAFLWIGGQAFANDVRIINTEMVETALWVRDNVPQNELLAVHDIGAIGYYAPRPILDLAGLVSPEIVPIIIDLDAQMELICEREAQWLMVFPDQRPTTPDDPRLQIAYESPYNFANEARASETEIWKMRVYAVDCDALPRIN